MFYNIDQSEGRRYYCNNISIPETWYKHLTHRLVKIVAPEITVKLMHVNHAEMYYEFYLKVNFWWGQIKQLQ